MQCQCCVGFGVLTAYLVCKISLGIVVIRVGRNMHVQYIYMYSSLESEVICIDCYAVFNSEGAYSKQL